MPTVINQQIEETKYRVYITDTLKSIAENTAKQYGGTAPSVRYADLIMQKEKESTNKRTPEELAAEIIKRHGLKLEGGG